MTVTNGVLVCGADHVGDVVVVSGKDNVMVTSEDAVKDEVASLDFEAVGGGVFVLDSVASTEIDLVPWELETEGDSVRRVWLKTNVLRNADAMTFVAKWFV